MQRRRLSRRGILKLFSAGAMGAWAASVFPEFPLAKAAQASTASNRPDMPMQSFVELDDSSPLVIAALRTEGMQTIIARHGRAALSRAGHAVYGDGSVHAVTMSLAPANGGVPRAVYGFFLADKPADIRIVQMELVIKQVKPFTGSAALLDPSDRVVTSASFVDDRMQGDGRAQAGVALPGVPVVAAYSGNDYWSCLSWCLSSTWPKLPWWIQLGCGLACGGCRSGFLPDCGACVGCLGGYAGACIVWCNCAPFC